MELDKRVGDYAAAIVRDVDLLLADASNFNVEQQKWTEALKRDAVLFQSLFTESLKHFGKLTDDSRIVFHDLRRPLLNIEGFSDLLLSDQIGSVNQSQTQLLQQIQAAHHLIESAFIVWLNPRDLAN